MIDVRLEVELDDGTTWTVQPTVGTFVKWERQYSSTVGALFSAETSLEHMCWIAWEQSRKDGHTVPLFDKFLESAASVKVASSADPLSTGEASPIT